MLQTKQQKGQKGFTLVELMIVVAIIGILAAIAIPQFAQYRIRGFNSSALSDIRNLTTAQEAFFADWLLYAVTFDVDGGANDLDELTAGGGLLEGPSNADMVLAQYARDEHRQLPLAIGNGVVIQSDVVASTAVSYAAISKHLQGNTMYGGSNNITAIYRDQKTLEPGEGGTVKPISDSMPTPHATDDVFAGYLDFEPQ